MKHNEIIAIVALGILSLPANAAPQWYISAGASATRLETDGLVDAFASEGLAASYELVDSAFGFQVAAGAKLTQNFGVEIKYSDSGDAEDTIFVTDGIDIIPVNVKVSLDGFTLYGVAETTVAGNWTVFGKLGYTMQDGKVSADSFGLSASSTDDDDGVALAGGLRYQINPNKVMQNA